MPSSTERGLTPLQTAFFALAAGALVANIYYAQALVTVIGPAFGLHAGLAGLAVTLTQLGYAAGLILIVSLADLFENRRLILLCILGTAISLIVAAIAASPAIFLAGSFAIGCAAAGAVQIIVPLAAHLSPEHRRGRIIGSVMGGLLAGIMLARPFANFVAAGFGWRAVFEISAAVTIVIGVLLWFALPVRHPRTGLRYADILASLWHLLVTQPLLRRRAAYQATVFAGFNLFWTAVPLVLSRAFGFDERGIALFALAGAGGALAAPIAGRLADHGYTRIATIAAMLVLALSFLASGWGVAIGSIAVLVLAAVVLDAATQTNQILSQRLIYGIDPHARGRINGIYMTSIFLAGALGSLLAGAIYYYGGWWSTMLTGAALGGILLALVLIEGE